MVFFYKFYHDSSNDDDDGELEAQSDKSDSDKKCYNDNRKALESYQEQMDRQETDEEEI